MDKEYFVVANSFAAPFVSDTDEMFIKGKSPYLALKSFVKKYRHPAGLYAAMIYKSADAYHKGAKPLGKYLCNLEIEKLNRTVGLGCYTFRRDSDNEIEIDGKKYRIDNPKGGQYLFSKKEGGKPRKS